METEIVRAEPSDFSVIRNLMLKALKEDPTAFSVTFEEYNFNSDEWWQRYIMPFLNLFDQLMFLAKEGNDTVGMIGALFENKSRKRHISTIVWFYVAKEHRKKGIGKKLIDSIINEIKQKSWIKKIALMVNEPQVSAKSMYEKVGFLNTGILKKELNIDGTFYDVHIMEKELV